jgi:GT2 family glycosyltransferase
VWPALAAPAVVTAGTDNAELYALWRAHNEPDAAQLAAQRRIASKRRGPVFSVVVPVFAPPADAFGDGIRSVFEQTWPHWELLLVMSGPQPDDVQSAARHAAAQDARVRLVEKTQNEGIAANTNAGLAAATGEYVLFLDHDDQLSPETLFEAVREIDADGGVEQVSFDEDKLSPDGRRRHDPLFKPSASSPEHLLSINYRMRSVIRKSIVDEVGGLRSEVDGAQDWDLALRLLERGTRARHVPRVLYHWRQVPGSAASDALAKPWAFAAQLKALAEHLQRLRLPEPAVEQPRLGTTRVGWHAPSPRVSIIIPTKDRAGLLECCIRSVREKTTYANYEILIVDTGSVEDETRALYTRLSSDGCLRFLKDDRRPFNYSRVNNVGAREATGDVLVFLNNDIEVLSGDWLEEMVRWAVRPEIGCVGAKLVYPDGTLQHAGIIMGMGGHCSHVYQGGPADHTWGVFGSVDFYRNYLALGGACLAVRRDLFQSLGGFDEAYELCYSDIALCLEAVQAGLRNVYTPFARLVHHEGGTRGRHFPSDDVLRASVHMYPLVVHGDPFYSPNLAFSFETRIPTIAVENDATARGAQLTRIAASFGIDESWQQTLLDERLGRTSHWKTYEGLLRAVLPPLSAFVPPASASEGARAHRILLVCPELSRDDASVLLSVVGALRAQGHGVVVLSAADGRLRESLEEAGARVVVEPLAVAAPYVFIETLASFDLVVPSGNAAWPVVLAAKNAGRPVVWLATDEAPHRTPGHAKAVAMADDIVRAPATNVAARILDRLCAGANAP